jgi:putative hydrolase of the HAD superfamily
MITTVVFDMDDTLYDEIDYCKSGFNAVAASLSKHPNTPNAEKIFESLWNQFASGNHTRTFNAALDELKIPYNDEMIKSLIELYRNHKPNLTLPAETKNVLDQLSGKYKLAMLTDGFMPAQQLKVRALGIEQYFQKIVYTEQLGRQFWKPSPVGFEKIIEGLNEKPQNMAYIADNQAKDFIAPNRLGMATIRIIRTNRIHHESEPGPNAAPRSSIDQIDKLAQMLERL